MQSSVGQMLSGCGRLGFEVLEAVNSAEAEQVLESTAGDALFLSVRPR